MSEDTYCALEGCPLRVRQKPGAPPMKYCSKKHADTNRQRRRNANLPRPSEVERWRNQTEARLELWEQQVAWYEAVREGRVPPDTERAEHVPTECPCGEGGAPGLLSEDPDNPGRFTIPVWSRDHTTPLLLTLEQEARMENMRLDVLRTRARLEGVLFNEDAHHDLITRAGALHRAWTDQLNAAEEVAKQAQRERTAMAADEQERRTAELLRQFERQAAAELAERAAEETRLAKVRELERPLTPEEVARADEYDREMAAQAAEMDAMLAKLATGVDRARAQEERT
ncbi:MAG: hypothetical protein M3P11_10770 [Actinomycetota bacterium]|nr:hypothetical protein [Actinomycetota bacterium]